jgi:salicylate hydroxylase
MTRMPSALWTRRHALSTTEHSCHDLALASRAGKARYDRKPSASRRSDQHQSEGSQTSDIIIIGGGIAGLTAALALQQQGKTVRLFEQSSQFGDVGAGLTLSQPASRGLFSLGLRPQIEAASDIPVRAGGADYRTGERLGGPDRIAEARASGDIPYFYQLHRADLHAILADAVIANDAKTVAFNSRCVGLAQDEQGATAIFENGVTARGDVVIGADGINSRVRPILFGEAQPRFTGQVAYRFLVPIERVQPFMSLGPSVNFVGPNRGLLRYVIRHGTIVNGVAFVRTDSWTDEGWSTPVDRAELLEKFEGWTEDVMGLLRNAPKEGTRKWALFDRDPLPQWTQGRITLLGDAAHPMLPFLGLGAAMGIEDAVVLGRAFAQTPDPQAALRRYENSRRERANTVLIASRRRGEVLQSTDKAKTSYDDSEELFAYDPATVALTA